MKTISATIISLLISVTYSMASANGSNGEGLGMLATFLIAFGILVIVFQLVPGLLLFVGMIKGLFTPAVSNSSETVTGNINKNS